MKVILTGGTGFVGAHVLKVLIERGHEVVLAVRTESKAREVIDSFGPGSKITHVVVGDIAAPGAFDNAVKEHSDVEGIIHTASPFHFRAKDIEVDLLEPAINGTTGILKAVKAYAPSVKKIVITSSMAAVMNPFSSPEQYTEESWNPITKEQAISNPMLGYLGSKTFAERAAWDFVKSELPNAGLSTICPPAVLGPVIQPIASLDKINTSNEFMAAIVQGKWKDGAPPTFTSPWVDARDVALSHVLALEKPEASGRRFLMHGGFLTNADYVEIVRKNFPALGDRLPEHVDKETITDAQVDMQPAQQVLGIKFGTLERAVTDTIQSMLRFVS